MTRAVPTCDDLVDFTHVITACIWNGREVGLIRRCYAADCIVHTPMGPVRGAEAVVAGTNETLHAFPDRRLLPEDVVWSGDAAAGYLSSHRIVSTMHHRGERSFGAAKGAARAHAHHRGLRGA